MANKLLSNDKKFIADCKKVKKGEMTLEELLATLKLRFYIPIDTKIAVADLVNLIISNKTNVFEDDEGISFEAPAVREVLEDYEIFKFYFIISQYIGIQISLENGKDVYDLFHEIGLYEYLIQKSYDDFQKFESLVDDLTGIRYYALTKTIKDMFEDIPTQKKLQDFANVLKSVDANMLEKMNRVANFADPKFKVLSEVVDKLPVEAELKKFDKTK